MAGTLPAYLIPLSHSFEITGDPEIARGQKDYLLGKFEFYGIKKPVLQALVKDFFKEDGLPDRSDFAAVVRLCWEQPQREWHYVGMALARKFVKKAEPEDLKLYEYMITNQSWWDTVDEIAVHMVGPFFTKYPELIRPETERMMRSDDFWLQRTAILFQRNYKDETDGELLFEYCARLAGEKEFFIRKVIGWALREYSKYNPKAVTDFVAKTPLQPLSKKEALRLIPL